MTRKKAAAQPSDEEVQISFRLTPEGLAKAEATLATLRRKIRGQARQELLSLMDSVHARNPDVSEDELVADIEGAREAYYREKLQQEPR